MHSQGSNNNPQPWLKYQQESLSLNCSAKANFRLARRQQKSQKGVIFRSVWEFQTVSRKREIADYILPTHAMEVQNTIFLISFLVHVK